MIRKLQRPISYAAPRPPAPVSGSLRRTTSLVERRNEDRKVLSYLGQEPGCELEALNQLIDELSVSLKSRDFWFPNEDDRAVLDAYFSDQEVITEWESKYDSLLRHQVTQRDTQFLGMKRRVKALLSVFSGTQVVGTVDNELDIHYLEAWINDLSTRGYARENLEMKLVYGIDLEKFKEEIKSADKSNNGVLSKSEFILMMKNYHLQNNYQTSSAWERAWNAIAYADQISCSPPPLGIITICLLNIVFYILKILGNSDERIPFCSKWIYNPNRRYEVWRFSTCSFIHVEPFHLINNMILLLLVGVPLEMYHSTWRTIAVFIVGSLSGSLLVSVIDKNRALAGASGGVSSLAAAHVADIALNWTEDTIIFRHRLRTNRPARVIRSESVRIGRLVIIGVIISLDVYNCLRQRYGSSPTGEISYISHIGGAIFGFLVGYLVLHLHFFRKTNTMIRLLLFIGCLSLWLFMILEHVLNSDEFPPQDHCDLLTFERECQEKCLRIPQRDAHRGLACNITYC